MSNKTRFINADRRRFVQSTAIVGGVAATGATVVQAATTDTQAPESANPQVKQHAGYQLTDRVKEYYRKARF